MLALLGLFASVKSWFLEREEGFGVEMNKSSKGYSRWAKDKEIKRELSRVEIKQNNSKEAGVPILVNSEATGMIVIISEDEKLSEVEMQLASIVSSFMTKYLEQ